MQRQALDRDDIISYIAQRVDRRDLDGDQFNHLLQGLGIEPPSESARIGSTGTDIPEDRKGAGIE